ncbi:MAG: hypothetical protein WB788_05050 [Thermoplasmata archaeon]
MSFPRPEVDIRSPPADFEERVDWLERWSYGLVLLEEYPMADLRSALASVESAVRSHRTTCDRRIRRIPRGDEESDRGASLLLSDHEWFETSLEQFWWFFRVVEKEDHGGHRQALGQYGRVLGEALRRHLAEERALQQRVTLRDLSRSPGAVKKR